MDMLYLHNDIFLTHVIGYDRLKNIYTPKMKSWIHHCSAYRGCACVLAYVCNVCVCG